MNFKTCKAAVVLANAALIVGSANAATLVTFNSAGNGVDTSATATTFQATGATGAINTTFKIDQAFGTNVGWTEKGTFQIASFGVTPGPGNPLGTVNSNVLVGYDVFADIDFSGKGNWTLNEFKASSGSFGLSLRAVNKAAPLVDIALGTAFLTFTPLTKATVTIDPFSTEADTTLTGTFKFLPAPGTTGGTNFFVAPSPFNINFSVGNFGGNPNNTTYEVDSITGEVRVFTPGPGLPAATGNLTFVGRVPEPGALALVGIALAGLGLSRRRKAA